MKAMLLTILLLATGLSACGGGGGDGSTTVVIPNAMVGGLWNGTITIDGVTYQAAGMSAENGEFELFQFDATQALAVQYWGTLRATGNLLTASFTGAILDGNGTFSDGSVRGTGTASGGIQGHSSINVTTTFTTSLGTLVTGQLALINDVSYQQASSLAVISGNYTDIRAPGSDILSISSDGVVTYASDPTISQCVANGTVSIVSAPYAVYGVHMIFSNCTGGAAAVNGVDFNGLATVDGSANPRLVVFMLHGVVLGQDEATNFRGQGT